MKKSKTLNNTYKEGPLVYSILKLLPAIIFSSVVITIVRAHVYTQPLSQFYWTEKTDDTVITDFFAYDKMVLLVICAVIAALMIFTGWATGNLKLERSGSYKYIAVYTAFVLLSYIFCSYKDFALLGYQDRFEGLLSLLSYMIMLVFIYNMVQSARDVKIMMVPLGVSMFLLGLLGVSQSMDHDFFRTVLGQKLITPNRMLDNGIKAWDFIDQLAEEGNLLYKFTFTHREVYQTVYNINYTSFYLSLILPICALIFIKYFNDKEGGNTRIAVCAASLGLYALSLHNFFCANSASGYFGLVVMALGVLIFFHGKIKEWLKPGLIIVLASVLVMVGISERWLPEVSSKAKETISTSSDQIIGEDGVKRDPFVINDIVTYEDGFSMEIMGSRFDARLEESGALSFTDEEGKTLDVELINGDYVFSDPRFAPYASVKLGSGEDGASYAIVTTVNPDKYKEEDPDACKYDWVFRYNGVKFMLMTPVGYFCDSVEVPKFGFEGHYNFGSGRGYIWSRSIPMLKDTLLIGHGPDTYCLYFPHYDYAGKYSSWRPNIVVDKPHSWYLDIGINTGCVSLAAMLGLYAYYLLDCLRGCVRLEGKDAFLEYTGCGIFLGIAAFLVVALFNDSTVSTAPLFYSLLGLGLAINRILRKLP